MYKRAARNYQRLRAKLCPKISMGRFKLKGARRKLRTRTLEGRALAVATGRELGDSDVRLPQERSLPNKTVCPLCGCFVRRCILDTHMLERCNRRQFGKPGTGLMATPAVNGIEDGGRRTILAPSVREVPSRTCPQCGCVVRADRLDAHMRERCSSRQSGKVMESALHVTEDSGRQTIQVPAVRDMPIRNVPPIHSQRPKRVGRAAKSTCRWCGGKIRADRLDWHQRKCEIKIKQRNAAKPSFADVDRRGSGVQGPVQVSPKDRVPVPPKEAKDMVDVEQQEAFEQRLVQGGLCSPR